MKAQSVVSIGVFSIFFWYTLRHLEVQDLQPYIVVTVENLANQRWSILEILNHLYSKVKGFYLAYVVRLCTQGKCKGTGACEESIVRIVKIEADSCHPYCWLVFHLSYLSFHGLYFPVGMVCVVIKGGDTEAQHYHSFCLLYSSVKKYPFINLLSIF